VKTPGGLNGRKMVIFALVEISTLQPEVSALFEGFQQQ